MKNIVVHEFQDGLIEFFVEKVNFEEPDTTVCMTSMEVTTELSLLATSQMSKKDYPFFKRKQLSDSNAKLYDQKLPKV